ILFGRVIVKTIVAYTKKITPGMFEFNVSANGNACGTNIPLVLLFSNLLFTVLVLYKSSIVNDRSKTNLISKIFITTIHPFYLFTANVRYIITFTCISQQLCLGRIDIIHILS